MCAASRDKKPGFDSEFTGEILRIKLRGEIDHHSAVAVRTAIDDMIKSKRPHKLIIDMSAVELMDSSGLGLIMGRYSLMKEMGGETVVADPNTRIEKIMALAGLERIVKVEYSSPRQTSRPYTPQRRQRTSTTMSVSSGQGGRRTSSRGKTEKGEIK